MDIEYKQYEDSGIHTRYFIVGKGQTILFLHGGGVSVLAYKELIELLAKRYQVIGVDIPCFGNADVPNTLWNFSDFGNYFKRFIKTISVNKVTVIGHSLGAGIGICLATNSDRVSNLVLVDSAGLSRGNNLFTFYYTFFITKTLNGIVRYKQLKKFISLGKYFLLNVIKRPLQQFKVFQIMNYTLSQTNLPINEIKASTLILWGNHDEIFPVNDAYEFQKRIHNSKLTVVDGNHDWCLFYPAKINKLINDFLG